MRSFAPMICLPLAMFAVSCDERPPAAEQDVVTAQAPAPPAPSPAAVTNPRSPEAAVAVVRRYHDLVAAGDYLAAYALWADGGRASGMSAAEFAASFEDYASWTAEVGEPGRIEGAAGSLYIEVPVRVSGRLTQGGGFERAGSMTLRRVNEVPGSTEAQRRWHISATSVRPPPD